MPIWYIAAAPLARNVDGNANLKGANIGLGNSQREHSMLFKAHYQLPPYLLQRITRNS